MKRILVFSLLLTSLVLSCGRREEAERPEAPEVSVPVDGDWLIRRMGAEPATLNPITATDAAEQTVNRYVMESLLWRDYATLDLKPELAERWEVSEDRMVYTFTLRQGVRWHDGVPFTVDDILYSFERIMDPKVDALHVRNYYQDIERVEKVDGRTVRFTYKKPYFRALEICGGIPIVAKHLFDDGSDFNTNPRGRHPIGTGSYRFREWKTGGRIVLERNEDYWGRKPHFLRVVFKIVPEDPVALQIFKKGELDTLGLTPIQWERQTGSARFARRFRKIRFYVPHYSYIGWNMRTPYFGDSRVRLAMTHLIDREKIKEKIYYGMAKIVTGNFYVNSPDYNQAIQPWPYDPKRARQLLKEAGWIDRDGDGLLDRDGAPFRFEFLLPSGNPTAEQLATLMKEDLRKEGIEMGIRKLEWATFLTFLNDWKFDATSLGWSLPYESDPYQLWHSSLADLKASSNFVGFKNAEADRIIEEARRTFDPRKRRKLFHRFHEIIHEEQPYTFLFCPEALMAYDRRIRNVKTYVIRPGFDIREWYVPVALQRYGK